MCVVGDNIEDWDEEDANILEWDIKGIGYRWQGVNYIKWYCSDDIKD